MQEVQGLVGGAATMWKYHRYEGEEHEYVGYPAHKETVVQKFAKPEQDIEQDCADKYALRDMYDMHEYLAVYAAAVISYIDQHRGQACN